MTIAAGFFYKDGVLMCSDTAMEDGYHRDHGYKLVDLQGAWGNGIAAFSGNVDVAVAAIQKFDNRLRAVSPEEMFGSLESLLTEEYRTKVFDHPLYGSQNPAAYSLLLALNIQGDRPRLYATSENTIYEVHRFRCIGIGASLASYLVTPYLLGNLEEEEILCLASYALAGTKRTVVGCGGLSLFKALRNDGTTQDFIGQSLPRHVEIVAQEFDRYVDQLLVAMMCAADADFDWNVNAFGVRIREMRLKVRTESIGVTIDELPKRR